MCTYLERLLVWGVLVALVVSAAGALFSWHLWLLSLLIP